MKNHIQQAAIISTVICVGLIIFWQTHRSVETSVSAPVRLVSPGLEHPAQSKKASASPSELTEQVQSLANAVTKKADDLDRTALPPSVTQALLSAPSKLHQTATQLMRFAQTGQIAELQNVTRKDVEALAKHLAKQMSRSQIADVLARYLGAPRQGIMAADDMAAGLMNLYGSMTGTLPSSELVAPLVITDNCTTDARVIGHTHVLPEGIRQVYAVFENTGTLRGLDNVLVVWRNPSDESLVYSKYESLRPSAAYNYVWLHVDDGWPAGSYQVEFYNPRDKALLLAKQQFDIQ